MQQHFVLTVLDGQDRLDGVGTKSSSSEKVTFCGGRCQLLQKIIFLSLLFVKHLLGTHDGLAAIEAPHPTMQL